MWVVVSGCCKEVPTIYVDFLIILLFPTPLVLALSCSSIPTSLFILKMFFRSLYIKLTIICRFF